MRRHLQTQGYFYDDWGTCPPGNAPTTVMTVVFRRLICRLLVATVVFVQLATAAHACASLAQATAAPIGNPPLVAAAMYATPGGDDTRSGAASRVVSRGDCGAAGRHVADSTFSNVCDVHCQSGQQRADNTSPATVPMALLASSYPLPSLYDRPVQRGFPVTFADPPQAADPPHAILHCCLRL